jgi:polysaccharide pyruvyl transferase WcaK-like protein
MMAGVPIISLSHTPKVNKLMNEFNFHEYVPDIPLEKSLGYASAVGLALPRSEN